MAGGVVSVGSQIYPSDTAGYRPGDVIEVVNVGSPAKAHWRARFGNTQTIVEGNTIVNQVVATATATATAATPQMSVSPETNISASGYPGDDFTTHSLTYTLTNTGTVAVAWSVSHVASWVTISATSGTLAVGASTTVTVSVNSGASLLSAGQRMDFIDFYGDVA